METTEVSTMQVEKRFVSGNELVRLSRKLAKKIADAGFVPEFMIGIWRGGAVPSMCVQEYLQQEFEIDIDLIPIRTSSRNDFTGSQKSAIEVHATGHACARMHRDTKVLIVDDVFDSGRTIEAVLKFFRERLAMDCPDQMRVATVFYKPERTAVDMDPDFFQEETDEWLVFPHEMCGLTDEERWKQKLILQKGAPSVLPVQEKSSQQLKQVRVLIDVSRIMTRKEKNDIARTLLTLYLTGMPWDARATFSYYYKYSYDYKFKFDDTELTITIQTCAEDIYKEEIFGSCLISEFLWEYDLIEDGPFEEVFEVLEGGGQWRELAEVALKATEVGKE